MVVRQAERNRHSKLRSPAAFAFHRDFSAHQLYKVIYDGKSQAAPALVACRIGGFLLKGLVNPVEKGLGHANACILYGKLQIRKAPRPVRLPYSESNSASRRRKLQGI